MHQDYISHFIFGKKIISLILWKVKNVGGWKLKLDWKKIIFTKKTVIGSLQNIRYTTNITTYQVYISDIIISLLDNAPNQVVGFIIHKRFIPQIGQVCLTRGFPKSDDYIPELIQDSRYIGTYSFKNHAQLKKNQLQYWMEYYPSN